jgi:hypothetical protein
VPSKITFLIIVVLLKLSLKGQDTLYFRDSTALKVVLLEINPENIKYKRFDNQAGPTYNVEKKEVRSITYANGIKEQIKIPTKKIEENEVIVKGDSISKAHNVNLSGLKDTIYFLSGRKVIAKIVDVQSQTIKYQVSNLDGEIMYTVNKLDLKKIVTSTGAVKQFEVLSDNQNVYVPNTNPNNAFGGNFYQKGRMDAAKYYTRDNGSTLTGCMAAGCSPCVGLIPAIVISNNAPALTDLKMPISSYSKNYEYMRGYQDGAHEIRKKKVWSAYGIGSVVFVGITVAYFLIATGI